jgi:nicotinamidase-related amidase
MTTTHSHPDPNARLLDRDAVALMVVDLQSQLVSAMFEAERLLANTDRLLYLAEVLKLPVVVTTQYARGLGPLHPEVLRRIGDLKAFDKTSFGCFGDPSFASHLRTVAPRATTLLVAGVESHICVTQTALGAMAAGYLVHAASDAISSRASSNWQLGLERMERAGAVISSTEMAIYELLGRAGTSEFKSMLPHLK